MAFRATQALRMVVKKTSTGLVGLAVDTNGRANYIAMQKKILENVKVRGGRRSDQSIFDRHCVFDLGLSGREGGRDMNTAHPDSQTTGEGCVIDRGFRRQGATFRSAG